MSIAASSQQNNNINNTFSLAASCLYKQQPQCCATKTTLLAAQLAPASLSRIQTHFVVICFSTDAHSSQQLSSERRLTARLNSVFDWADPNLR